jgi:hypothetical protein
MLRARRSWVRFPVKSFNFSVGIILPAALTDMNTRNLPAGGGRGRGGNTRPSRKADNLTAICEQIV